MIMRYLLLSLLFMTLLGCQAQQPDPSEVVAQTLSTTSPTSIPELPNTTPTETHVGQTEPAETANPCSIYDPEPATAVLANGHSDSNGDSGTEPFWSYRVVNVYPHDTGAFTQGLVIEENLTTLLEGTGEDSSLRRVDLVTGEIQQYFDIPDEYFGEGITKFNNRIIQLTWLRETGIVFDQETFEVLEIFNYPHQGWGITHDDNQLIVSDGSDIIRYWDPETFQEVRRIQVTSEYGPVTQLNELEYINGEIWANVWKTDVIVRISPEDGRVLGWLDLSGLLSPFFRQSSNAVLNGIAYDEESCRLFVTGKLWPALFEIEVVKPDSF